MRKSVLVFIVVAIAAGIGAFLVFKGRKAGTDAAPEAVEVQPAPEPAGSEPPAPASAPAAVAERPPAIPPPPPITSQPATPPATTPAPAMPASAFGTPTPETRNLVSTLASLNLQAGTLTPEQAAAWKENLQKLAQQGAAAVPAIAEFLALNKDLDFKAAGADKELGSVSLRLSLLQTLTAAGGPEAMALSAQTLQTTRDPAEVGLLAQYLVGQAPEQYRDTALAAARDALGMAAGGQLAGRDVGPLFNVLVQYGGTDVLNDLQQAASGTWRYYATIALAKLPDGAGVPALVQMVTDPKNAAYGSRMAALQSLGQLAATSPDAQNALLAQARAGAIPSASWINLASVLGGDRFYIGELAAENVPNAKTFHLNFGKQNYYLYPNAEMPQPEIDNNLRLIDTLLASTTDPLAVDSLNKAKTRLNQRNTPGQ
jgi:hypothetical protein